MYVCICVCVCVYVDVEPLRTKRCGIYTKGAATGWQPDTEVGPITVFIYCIQVYRCKHLYTNR